MVVVDTSWLICSIDIEINKCALNLYTGVRVLQNRTMKGNSELAFKCVLMSLVTCTGLCVLSSVVTCTPCLLCMEMCALI